MRKVIKYIFLFFIVLGLLLFIFGFRFYTVLSGSMENTINVYDIVVCRKVSKNEIRVKDIISFSEGDKVVTHRVVKIDDGYVTKGDNNNTVDNAKVHFKDVNGKVLFIIPKAGRIILFLKSKWGLAFLFSILFIIYFIDSWIYKKE
ncbi:MAG: signal peptidase I [Bacilli bacterium]|nr:signal peptidase I [Bacilli bacterium]